MQVLVRGKGVVVTDALREYADRKVNKLNNHFHNLTGATMTQIIQGQTQKVEVQLECADGMRIRCEERGDDLYVAIDRVVDKLERQMQKVKNRQHRNGHNGTHHHHHYGHHGEVVSPRTAPVEIDGLEPDPVTGRIVRHKKFGIKPLAPGEAVDQMELLSHDFFVFENAQTGYVNVLYRREDGNYGILEPEH